MNPKMGPGIQRTRPQTLDPNDVIIGFNEATEPDTKTGQPIWSPPTPEQESLREPWIDPTTAFAGGFGANIMRRGLMGALRGGTAAAVADYPLGLATAGVENIDPRLAMPFNLIGGMASGASFERGLENAMAGKAHPVRTAQRALGNAMGQVDVWHGSPHSFDRFSMDKIGTGEGAQAFGYGLYFTDLVDVAKHYAQMPKKKNVLHINGLEQEDSHAARLVKDVIKRVGPKKHLILHQLKNGLRRIEETQLNNKDAYIKYQKEAIKIAESGDKFEIKDYA
jgi:hypothetical protein